MTFLHSMQPSLETHSTEQRRPIETTGVWRHISQESIHIEQDELHRRTRDSVAVQRRRLPCGGQLHDDGDIRLATHSKSLKENKLARLDSFDALSPESGEPRLP